MIVTTILLAGLSLHCEITRSAALRRGPQRGSRVGVESCPAAVGRPEGLRYERPRCIPQECRAKALAERS